MHEPLKGARLIRGTWVNPESLREGRTCHHPSLNMLHKYFLQNILKPTEVYYQIWLADQFTMCCWRWVLVCALPVSYWVSGGTKGICCDKCNPLLLFLEGTPGEKALKIKGTRERACSQFLCLDLGLPTPPTHSHLPFPDYEVTDMLTHLATATLEF